MNRSEKIQKVLQIMLDGDDLELSKVGVKELNRPPENWNILALNCDYTVEICSDSHFIFTAAPLDWLAL